MTVPSALCEPVNSVQLCNCCDGGVGVVQQGAHLMHIAVGGGLTVHVAPPHQHTVLFVSLRAMRGMHQLICTASGSVTS